VQETHTRGQRGWDRAVRWGGRSFAGFFSHTADTLTTEVDPSVLGSNGGEFTTAPWGREGAVLQGVLIEEAVEMLVECTRDCRGSTGARAIHQALDPLMGKAMPPCAHGSIGKLERVRDVWKAWSFDDCTDGLGATEDAHLFGLLEHRLSRGQSRIGQWELKRPHRGPLFYKLLRKVCKTISYAMRLSGDPRIGATSFRLKFSRSCFLPPPST
jgi:hypothetical protein